MPTVDSVHIELFEPEKEILTNNGRGYVMWVMLGKSANILKYGHDPHQ